MSDFHDLGAVLDRATDRIERHFDPADVLAQARRRRVRQRGIVAGAVTAAAVVAVVISVQAVGGNQRTQDLPPATQTPSESAGQARWDPRAVESLPAASGEVAPLLPDVLEVPDLAPHVEDDPVDAAVLNVDDGADVLLLGTDGRWRCVVVPGKTRPAPVLSPGGTRLAVATVDGVVTVDLATGTQSQRPVPSGLAPLEDRPFGMWWLDEQRLVILDGAGGWEVDVERGTEERVEEPAPPEAGWTVPTRRGSAADWAVSPVAELADGSQLLRVAPPRGSDRTSWWLVQWDPASDGFWLVSSIDSDPDKAESFARDLVGR